MDATQDTRRLGIRLRRDAVLENSPIQIGTLLAEIELADGTSLDDLQTCPLSVVRCNGRLTTDD